jgi:hypothetical protein
MQRRTASTIHLASAALSSCVLILSGAAACGAFSGSSATQDGGAADGGTASDAPLDDGFADVGMSDAPAGCSVIYVDGKGGADTNDGCSTTTRMRTVGAALSRAKAAAANEIHVCAGAYAEQLTLDAPIALLGSYDCGTFTRNADAGMVGQFKPTTTIASAAPAQSTVRISGALDAKTRLDGFLVQGSDAATSSAIYVTAGAAPTLSNLVVIGGGGVAKTGPGSIGVSIDDGAAPHLDEVLVSGGSGQNGAGAGQIGSVAVFAQDTGPFLITRSAIQGGSGISTGTGSIGIYVIATKAVPAGTISIAGSNIHGGSGVSTSDTIGSEAIDIRNDSRVVISQDEIAAGAGTCTTTACNLFAISATETPAIEVSRCAIYAGNPASTPDKTTGVGILAQGPPASVGTGVLAHDNMILAAGAQSSIGMQLTGLPNATVVDNTIVGGTVTGSTFGVALYNTTNAIVRNNLLALLTYATELSQNPPGGSCVTGVHIDNNAFVDDVNMLTTNGCMSIVDGSRTQLGLMNLALGSVATANTRIAPNCGTDNPCNSPQFCATDDACYATVMAKPAPDSTVLFAQGLALAASPPCVVAKGGQTIAGVPVDFYGQARVMPFSIGAQQTSTCSAP